ncbi:hypothetical protein GX51_07423 [Blastomyces parvus]|uniref:Uncharacterized protein n=1 Tax=Blastomyces parvus TaxID=2060905 RepID=A0A2B7WKX3_9EURO|nr:hypothetical protein GX51_07423 [Blastomyces parvus]
MKLTTTLLTAALAALAGGAAAKNYYPVYFQPPNNWIPSERLFPSRIIKQVKAPLHDHVLDEFTEMMKGECDGQDVCTAFSFHNENDPTQGRPMWNGYLYTGGPVTPRDFNRDEDAIRHVADSHAYNLG